jgi:hypothetical protein
VTADRGRAAPGAIVLAFSTDRERWYPVSRFMRKAVANADGTFRISGLSFGTYYVAAIARVPDDDTDGWQDPAFLDSLGGAASTVTLVEGEKQVLNLRLANR